MFEFSKATEHRSWTGHITFSNPWSTWNDKRFKDLLKFLLFDKNESNVPSNESELDEALPVFKPDFDSYDNDDPNQQVKVTWLGHASVLFCVDNAKVLCDPIFSDRCSPSQSIGTKRYRPPPCQVEDLPADLHAVAISHNHYDHLDVSTVQSLAKRFPNLQFFVPYGLKSWMISTLPSEFDSKNQVYEMKWWDEETLDLTGGLSVKMCFAPSQHWSTRNLFDRNTTLWGSWAIVGPNHKAWFAGDTGYCPAFKEIGKYFNGFDLCAIPIGAYNPRDFMKDQHVNPTEAVMIHQDVCSKRSLGIHWGTFVLTYEHYLEPKLKLAEAVQAAGLCVKDFVCVNHGQTLTVFDNGETKTT